MPGRPSVTTRDTYGGTLREASYFREWKSHANLCGVPFVHITSHVWDPRMKCVRWARGFIAIGPLALGVLAVGWVALGMFALGLPLAVALFGATGIIVFGGAYAIGNIALSFGFACGNIAMGSFAIGQVTTEWRLSSVVSQRQLAPASRV